ncbi:MAG: glycosylase, partial [Sphingobacteriales bacterium]
MNRINIIIFLLFCAVGLQAQKTNPVSAETMEKIYQEVKTPYKYGLVMVPDDKEHKMDCPTIFRKGKDWYMTYLIFSGHGYETWMAKSSDLLNWQNLGKIMSFEDSGKWDDNQKA